MEVTPESVLTLPESSDEDKSNTDYDSDGTVEADFQALYGPKSLKSTSVPNLGSGNDSLPKIDNEAIKPPFAPIDNNIANSTMATLTAATGKIPVPTDILHKKTTPDIILKRGYTIKASTHSFSYNSALSVTAQGSKFFTSTNMPHKSKKTVVSSTAAPALVESESATLPLQGDNHRVTRRSARAANSKSQPLTVEPESGIHQEHTSNENANDKSRPSKIVKLKVKVPQSLVPLDGPDALASAGSSKSEGKGKGKVQPVLELSSVEGKSEDIQPEPEPVLAAAKATSRKKRSIEIQQSGEEEHENSQSESVSTNIEGGTRKKQKRSFNTFLTNPAAVLEPKAIGSALRSSLTAEENPTAETTDTPRLEVDAGAAEVEPEITPSEITPAPIEATGGRKRSFEASRSNIAPPANRKSRRGQTMDELESDEAIDKTTGQRSTRKRPIPSWADRKSKDWDIRRFLLSDEFLAPDPLLELPKPNHSYLDRNGRLKDPGKYARYTAPTKKKTIHPKLHAHYKNGTNTSALRLYYQDLPPGQSLPIAGVIRYELPESDPRYDTPKGPDGRPIPPAFFPYTPNSPFHDLPSLMETLSRDFDLGYVYEELILGNTEQEDAFHSKPMIKLPVPDSIKAILVDDWENVTKNQQLVPLPSRHPVNEILDDYFEFEKAKTVPGPDCAILEEVILGLKEYFDKCLGRILLYRFERNQYIEVREAWQRKTGDLAGKSAGDTYGAEHLCRLIVTLPELIGQTNMDQQSVNRLREELLKLTSWLAKKAANYFVSEYETPNQEYIEKARNA